jgi:integrase/recombinase XerD
MQIAEYLNRFESYLQACSFAKNTREGYRRTLRKFCQYLEYSGSPMEADQIRKDHLVAFLAGCEENGEKANTVAVRALTLIKFFRWLKGEGAIREDPSERIPIPKERQRIPRYVSPAEVEALLSQPDTETVCGLRDRALMEVLYSSGLRISEALDLEIEDIDYSEGFIYVKRGKGGKSRAVPMSQTAGEWLTRYMLQGRSKVEVDCSRLVFLSCDGRRLSRQSAAKAFRQYVQSAGLPGWLSPHSLRHACATHMLHNRADLASIQQLLGHARPESTRIYTLVRCQDLKAVHTACHPRR